MKSMMVALTSATLLAAAAPVAAAQGTYDVVSCEANGLPVGVQAWTPSFNGWPVGHEDRPSPTVDRCAEGLGFGLDMSVADVTGPIAAAWTFTAPPGTSIASLVVRLAATHHRTPNAEQSFSYVARAGSETVLEASPAIDDWNVGSLEDTRLLDGHDARSVSVDMSCPAFVRCGGWPATVTVREARVTLRDAVAPVVGPLVVSSDRVKADFSDGGGGVSAASLVVDGKVVETVKMCRQPFVERVPCPLSGTAEFARPVVSGDARVAIVLTDAARNEARVEQWTLGTPGAALVLDTPTSPGVRGIVTINGRRTLRASYSKPPLIQGTLKTPEGSATGKARVAVTGTNGVMTDAQGRFSVRVPRGPSRTVTFAYGDSVQTVKLIVAAPVQLEVSPTKTRNGRSVTFKGTVPQAGKARTRVELQAWANGKWVPFKTVALKNGRFSAGYRFTRTFTAQRYRFRAVIQDDPNFVYAAGRSKEVRVLVRP